MSSLTKMIEESTALENKTIPERTIILTLANKFQSSTAFLFLDPEELTLNTGLGNRDQWFDFLNMQEVKNFVKGQMAFLSQVAQRKTFRGLVELALDGNQQAAKQVQELSGVLNQQDTNRTVVLHRIPRPEEV